ncbi:MAG: GNAT family protein [Candidatus Dormiibacterota bacterium]
MSVLKPMAGAGLPVGPRVDPSPAALPGPVKLPGRDVDLVALDPEEHGPALWESLRGQANDGLWAYLFDGPFSDASEFHATVKRLCQAEGYHFLAILDHATEAPLGWAALMRVEPRHRSIEVGYILYTPTLQRTRGATEAMYLLARYVFEELGYRRYEWKCNGLNTASRRAALRLGFTFEGVFRQHMIVKGRNRDTAWFSILDYEWPARRKRLEAWLEPSNFDETGRQKTALAATPTDDSPTLPRAPRQPPQVG